MAATDPRELQAILGGSRPPLASLREGRIELLGRAAEALLAGRLPEPEARLFLAGALVAWLEGEGPLEAVLRVNRRGSHETPQRIWARLISDERHGGARAAFFPASTTTDQDTPE